MLDPRPGLAGPDEPIGHRPGDLFDPAVATATGPAVAPHERPLAGVAALSPNCGVPRSSARSPASAKSSSAPNAAVTSASGKRYTINRPNATVASRSFRPLKVACPVKNVPSRLPVTHSASVIARPPCRHHL